jgi:hypothetical protein
MNEATPLDAAGQIFAAFHEGQPVFVHFQFEFLRVADFTTLAELGRATFKWPLVSLHIPPAAPSSPLRFIAVTEDQFANLIQLRSSQFTVLISVQISHAPTTRAVLLLNSQSKCHLFFEDGDCLPIAKSPDAANFKAQWPGSDPDNICFHVFRMHPCPFFEGQKSVAPNSASFIAFVRTATGPQISSWFLNFDDKLLKPGPFAIQISVHSQFLSSRYFGQNQELFSIFPFEKIAPYTDAVAVSNHVGDVTLFADAGGVVWRLSANRLAQIAKLSDPPVRIETNGTDFIYIRADGMIVSPTKGATTRILSCFQLSESNCIFVHPDAPSVRPFPVKFTQAPAPPVTAATIEETTVTSLSGATWTSAHPIVCSAIARHQSDEFIIVATAASVHILRSSVTRPSIAVVYENSWPSPISAVAISSRLYAVASCDKRIIVQSFHSEPYMFTFQWSLCFALSLSETTLAAGFCDGTFTLASLEKTAPLRTPSITNFTAPIRAISHASDLEMIVEWSEVTAKVSPSKIRWLRLPSFPAASVVVFGAARLALGTPHSLDIYSFADARLLARVPHRVVGAYMSGVPFKLSALTTRGELVVLHLDGDVSVRHQSIIDVEDPRAIGAVDETVYVVCARAVVVFDMRGHKLDTVALTHPPRFFDAASRGFFVGFSRMILYISRDQNTIHIEHPKGNLTGFSVVDDDRFCVTTNSRLLLCEKVGEKHVFSTVAKLPRRTAAVKCYRSRIDGPIDSVLVVFEDDEAVGRWKLPPLRDGQTDETEAGSG